MSSSSSKKKVLVLWHEACIPATLQLILTQIREEWSKRDGGADVLLEHVDRLKMAEYSLSSFDHALLGLIPPHVHVHSSDILQEVARILKPSGSVTLREPSFKGTSQSTLRTFKQLQSCLRLAGFINPQKVEDSSQLINTELITDLRKIGIEDIDNVEIVTMKAEKPSYEIGASAPLKLGGISTVVPLKTSAGPSSNSTQIWTLAANDILDDELDLMDSDTLLLEEDLIRPDPSSLRSACGPSSGKKKACKNCSCGLAEMENDEDLSSIKKKTTVTSSCGSCYLGDAFRCASCPYLGMPAFKPGQEIKLSDRQLTADQ